MHFVTVQIFTCPYKWWSWHSSHHRAVPDGKLLQTQTKCCLKRTLTSNKPIQGFPERLQRQFLVMLACRLRGQLRRPVSV